ncbi:hypothetical protein SCP_0804410 [Sparassis crispa]|uniref:Uncharacterized protein n=1 Tax=Sparassis crispa TaxID=139825 RepID=A0A401GUK4_9APHY|nr:hypothetical protein SCP_0804410 [Sparassis crispa]GBE85917.1 hypothetical protein SCP_0804410 [Sparassis crispa]
MHVEVEDDPFLSIPVARGQPSSVSSNSRSGSGSGSGYEYGSGSGSGYEYGSGAGSGHGYGPVALRQQVTLPSMLSNDDADDGIPYDMPRHKSIRSGILERLRFGTVRRPASQETVSSPAASTVQHRPRHRRADSDFNVDDVQAAASSASERILGQMRKTVRCRDKRYVVTGEEAFRRNSGYKFTGLECPIFSLWHRFMRFSLIFGLLCAMLSLPKRLPRLP